MRTHSGGRTASPTGWSWSWLRVPTSWVMVQCGGELGSVRVCAVSSRLNAWWRRERPRGSRRWWGRDRARLHSPEETLMLVSKAHSCPLSLSPSVSSSPAAGGETKHGAVLQWEGRSRQGSARPHHIQRRQSAAEFNDHRGRVSPAGVLLPARPERAAALHEEDIGHLDVRSELLRVCVCVVSRFGINIYTWLNGPQSHILKASCVNTFK